jgi:MYXO-CTERM domain-containing protein
MLGAMKNNSEKSLVTYLAVPVALAAMGVTVAIAGICIGEKDDAPGAALMGVLLMLGLAALAVKIARRKP